jgi:sec-independent protein translocase protein TatA
MLQNLTGWHFLIILVVVLLLFGAPKLPGLARSLGQSMKIFKSEIKSDTVDGDPSTDAAAKPTNAQSTGTQSGTQSPAADETHKAAGSADTSTKP